MCARGVCLWSVSRWSRRQPLADEQPTSLSTLLVWSLVHANWTLKRICLIVNHGGTTGTIIIRFNYTRQMTELYWKKCSTGAWELSRTGKVLYIISIELNAILSLIKRSKFAHWLCRVIIAGGTSPPGCFYCLSLVICWPANVWLELSTSKVSVSSVAQCIGTISV